VLRPIVCHIPNHADATILSLAQGASSKTDRWPAAFLQLKTFPSRRKLPPSLLFQLSKFKMISKTITCIVRGAQAVFAIVILGLVGNMISTSGWNMIPRQGGNAAEVNYAMFLGVWTLLGMALFIPFALRPSTEPAILVAIGALDGLTALFYMCGGIALAAAMDIHSCMCFCVRQTCLIFFPPSTLLIMYRGKGDYHALFLLKAFY
jgi:hypothetical protein